MMLRKKERKEEKMARNTTGVKIDPKAVPTAEYDTACRILHSSIRLAMQNPTLRMEYEEWKERRQNRAPVSTQA